MDFMKPDLTTVHKEEPLLAIRLCSQHVRALLGWTAQYTWWPMEALAAEQVYGQLQDRQGS